MKITEILTEANTSQHKAPEKKQQSMGELVERLKKAGGQVYSEISHGTETGWLGYNGTGKKKVYFAFYPDGTMQRFESPVKRGDLKIGWTAKQYDDPEKVLKDKAKAEKIRKAEERDAMFEATVTFDSDEAMAKFCAKQHYALGGEIADAWIETDEVRKIGGRYVAYTEYCITLYNEDYDEDAEDADLGPDRDHPNEFHEPIYVAFYRDAKDPEKIHIR